jgi:hypothetical protein
VLTNSPLNQPVEISLRRDIAAKIGVANVPTNEPYAKLPTFVEVNGTIGKPTSKTDKTKLAALAASSIGNVILKNVEGATGQKIGGALNVIGDLFGGKPAATNAPVGTNAVPSASETNVFGTNAPGTNPPVKPNPLQDVLRNLTK